MGVYDTLVKTQTPNPPTTSVIKSKTNLNKGYLMGHISNGNGLIKLGNGYALKVIALDDKFVALYLLDYGIGGQIMPQTWQKTKAIPKSKATNKNKKSDTKKIEAKDSVEEESLFDS